MLNTKKRIERLASECVCWDYEAQEAACHCGALDGEEFVTVGDGYRPDSNYDDDEPSDAEGRL